MKFAVSLLKPISISLLLLSMAVTPLAFAQKATDKAYAPENLVKLTQPEQVRVLEKQFAELSGGRPLPEDQLEFYLEQIPRGWTYAQITEDMTQSLRDRADGNTFPNNPPPNAPPVQWTTPGWTNPQPGRGQLIQCESRDISYRECATGFRNAPVIERQLSSTRCVEGRNWGHRPGVVWVQGGCRALFAESAPVAGTLAGVTCSSAGGYRECNVPFRGPAELMRQVPRSSLCVEGRTWGQKPGVIWVDRGCGGVFAESYRPSGGFYSADDYDAFTMDCASLDGSYTVCSWDRRQGTPILLDQYSRQACIEGVSWGYTPRRGLWVDRGCRARFGSRG